MHKALVCVAAAVMLWASALVDGLAQPVVAQTTAPQETPPQETPLQTRSLSGGQGSLVLDAGLSGEAGMQADVATLSPRRAPSALSSVGAQTYMVQRGDTLSSIAARLKVSQALLAVQNQIDDADRLRDGQVLRVGGTRALSPALPADGPLAHAQFWPWPPRQGQTLVAWLRPALSLSTIPATASAGSRSITSSAMTLTFAGRPYPLVEQGPGAWVLIPLPSLLAPGSYPLAVVAGGQAMTLTVPVEAGAFETSVVPAEASDAILGQPDKVRAETARLGQLFADFSPSTWTPSARFRSPLAGEHARSSPYGSRRTYGSAAGLSAHEGEDFAADAGTPVYAPAAGTVVLAELLFVRGNAVVIDHGHGMLTGYWHMRALNVKAGDRVTAGQQIGEVGSTGLSTGPHLHWELHANGVAVDPLQWLGNSNP